MNLITIVLLTIFCNICLTNIKMNSYRDEIIQFTSHADLLCKQSSADSTRIEHRTKSVVYSKSQSFAIGDDLITPKTPNCSELLPNSTKIWENMMREYYKEREEVETYRQRNSPGHCKNKIPEGSIVEYMENQVFSILFPALTKALMEAVKSNSLKNAQTTFNGLDMISQTIWNNNPKYPKRAEENLNIFDMPWAQKILKEKPRPYFPKSWIYTPEIAAIKIQAYYKAHQVRKREDVQEVRQFWKVLKRNKPIKSDTEDQVISPFSSIFVD